MQANKAALELTATRWNTESIMYTEARFLEAQRPTYEWDSASTIACKRASDSLVWALQQARGGIWLPLLANIKNITNPQKYELCGISIAIAGKKKDVDICLLEEQREAVDQHVSLNFVMVRLRMTRLYEWLRSYQRRSVLVLLDEAKAQSVIDQFRSDMAIAEEMRTSPLRYVHKVM